MFTPTHYGLYFTPDHVAQSRKNRERDPLREAWELLHERKPQTADVALWGGLRWRFDDDFEQGEQAIEALRFAAEVEPTQASGLHTLKALLVRAHAFELLRDHRAFEAAWRSSWLNDFAASVSQVNQTAAELPYVEGLWLNLLNLVAGIVLERESEFERAAGEFRRVVGEDIHPQGYISRAVGGERDGGGLTRQLLAIEALVLTAEAAAHAGVNLWEYAVRGVSVMTACAYPMYYYYFPEKWMWDDAVTAEPFGQINGFWEIVNRHVDFKDLKQILDDLRPIYDAPGGGLTTLSHSVVKRRGLFG